MFVSLINCTCGKTYVGNRDRPCPSCGSGTPEDWVEKEAGALLRDLQEAVLMLKTIEVHKEDIGESKTN